MADVVAKIKLTDGSDLSVGKSFISSLKSVSESTTDASSVHYGILPNTGSLQIQDGNGYISGLIDDGLLPISNLDVEVDFNGSVFQHHITTDSDYNTEDRTLNISLSNSIKDLDILVYGGYAYPNESKTLYDMFYSVLYSYYNPQFPQKKYPDFIDNLFDAETLDYIKNIIIKYPVIEYGITYRKVIDNLCTIAQINAFAGKDNLIHFISARPICDVFDEITELHWKDIVQDLKYTKTLKNKFDGVSVEESKVTDELKYGETVYEKDFDVSVKIPELSLTDFNSGFFDYKKIGDAFDKDRYNSEVPNAFMQGAVGFVCIKPYYYDINNAIVIPKIQNDGLYRIQALKNIVDYDLYCVSATKSISLTTDTRQQSISAINFSGFTDSDFVSEVKAEQHPPNVSRKVESSFFQIETSKISDTATIELQDESYLSITEDNDNYFVNYHILCGFDIIEVGINNTLMLWSPKSLGLSGTITRYKPVSVSINVIGDVRDISFKNISASSDGIENSKVKASVPSSNLLQDTAQYKGNQIVNVIKNNILTDYRNGISDGKIVLNKDMVEIGDLIKYPNDRRVWRVVGKEFNYDGEYLFPISVMQCLKPYSSSGLFDEYDECVYTWDELIENGTVSVSGTELIKVDLNATGRLKIDNSIKSIRRQCFYDSKFDEVYISDSVETLGSHLFINCTAKKIVIGEGVKNIGNYAFNNMPNLQEIEYNAINCNDLPTENRVFWNSYSSGAVLKFGKSVQRVPNYLFCPYETGGIPSSTIKILDIKWENGTNPVEIGYKSFYGLNVMNNLQLPNNLTKIDGSAFYYGVQVNNIYYKGSMDDWLKIYFVDYNSRAFAYQPDFWVLSLGSSSGSETTFYDGKTYYKPTKLVTPSNISEIKQYSFAGVRQINEVIITSNITKIGINAFYGTKISSATFEDPNGWYYNGELLSLKYPDEVGGMLRTKSAYEWIKS